MEIANYIVFFVRTVDEGSFSAAARSLGLSPSAVSKQSRRLEDRVGVRLLNRSTRRITLTEEGRAFYQRCARIAAAIEEAESLASSLAGRVTGTLRVTATVAFAKLHLLPLFPGFVKQFPDLDFQLELTDRPVDLEANSADAVYHAALSGLGIARLSTYLVADDVRSGRLVRLLPDCAHEDADILVVYPDRRNLSPKVRAFTDFLLERFQPVPPWEAVVRAEPVPGAATAIGTA